MHLVGRGRKWQISLFFDNQESLVKFSSVQTHSSKVVVRDLISGIRVVGSIVVLPRWSLKWRKVESGVDAFEWSYWNVTYLGLFAEQFVLVHAQELCQWTVHWVEQFHDCFLLFIIYLLIPKSNFKNINCTKITATSSTNLKSKMGHINWHKSLSIYNVPYLNKGS